MSKGVNKVILIGQVGKDPKFKEFDNGGCAVNFSIATNDYWKNKETGKNEQHTEWHNIVAYEKLAKIINDYVKKGSKLYIEGSLRTRKWLNNDIEHYMTEIVCNNIQMLGDSKEREASSRNDGIQEKNKSNSLFDDLPF